jgi:hypothetical protein
VGLVRQASTLTSVLKNNRKQTTLHYSGKWNKWFGKRYSDPIWLPVVVVTLHALIPLLWCIFVQSVCK